VIGIGEAMAEPVVVREDEQPGGRAIQAPHREDPAADVREEVVDRGPTPGIAAGGDVARGLVEDEHYPLGPLAHGFAVDAHAVLGGVDPPRGVTDHRAADAHEARSDEALRFLPGGNSELRQGSGEGYGRAGGRTDRRPNRRDS
jgi:hypothetical protein